MRRGLVLFFVMLLPFQFAWSAAAAYCQHETTEQQSRHFGHHVHAHKGETNKSPVSKLMADADCASCHASGTVVIPTPPARADFAGASQPAAAQATPPFTSALARAPDRPQWLRLV